jgi:glycosyltransferase involved in cell wall biosynthesis
MSPKPRRVLGVNGIRLLGKRTGVGRAIEAILQGMQELPHPFDEIRVYSPVALPEDLHLPSMAHNVVLPSRLPLGLWEQVRLARAHGKAGLLLCPSYVAPVFAKSPVLLIHHGSYEGYPAAFSWARRTKARLIYAASAHAATLVSTVSDHSKRDIMRFYGVKPEKIRVIPEGVDTSTFRPLQDASRLSQWRRERLGQDVPCLLYVGKPTKRRNLPNLIQAFAALKHERGLPHKLVLIGTGSAGARFLEMASSLGIGDEVVPIDFADPAEIALAYNASEMLIYPSSYEGFGMPVLEAMACGTPTIALNNTAFPEFSAGIAELLEDAQPETLQEAIAKLLDDPTRRREIQSLGPERAAGYDWSRVTESYIALMRELIGS